MKRRFGRSSHIVSHPYSLIEMLVVIAIIAILVGIGAGGYTATQRWLATSKTESLLAKLKIAIESYKNDKGYYPLPHTDPTASTVPNFRLDVNTKDYFNSLPSPDDHLQPRENMNNFVDYGKVQDDQSLKVKKTDYYEYYPKDGWNTPSVTVSGNSWGAIKYRCPGLINKTSFDLYSAGYDRVFATTPGTDTKDDIYAE